MGADFPSVAMIGTRGVPARYGGFETCVEEVGQRLVRLGFPVTVYCRQAGEEPWLPEYLGMSLVHLPAFRQKSLETISHTALSVGHVVKHRTDTAIVFNAANAPFVPAMRMAHIPVAVHVDGLEWQRAKWGKAGRRYYRAAEAFAVRYADALIADAPGIARYYDVEFDVDTELISYGAPIVDPGSSRLAEMGLEPGGFHLIVARFEPENHVLEMVRGYVSSSATRPLVVVGSAPYADGYTRQIQYAADTRVRLLGGVWDQDLLDQLYAGAASYLHGHSVGGTNPSLLRAIGAGAAVTAFDVSFNRDVLGDAALYFTTPASVAECIELTESQDGDRVKRKSRARERALDYDWDWVTDSYADLVLRLASGELRRVPGRAGRRTGRRVDESMPRVFGQA